MWPRSSRTALRWRWGDGVIEDLLQNLIVAVIVLCAALHVARKYLPARWRQKLVFLLTARGASQSSMATWLNTASGCASGCAKCQACAPVPLDAASTKRVIEIVRR